MSQCQPNTSFIHPLYLGKLYLLYFGIYLRYIHYLQSQILTHCKSPFIFKIFHNYGMTTFPALSIPLYPGLNPDIGQQASRTLRLLILPSSPCLKLPIDVNYSISPQLCSTFESVVALSLNCEAFFTILWEGAANLPPIAR